MGDQIITNPRPTKMDEDVLAKVSELLLPELVQWGGWPQEQREEDLETLTELLKYSYDFDGYKLAKKLEDELYCDADSELVGILDRVEGLAYQITEKKVKEWVSANSILPAFKVGDRVKWPHSGRETMTGTVVAIHTDKATYTIQEDGKAYPPPPKGAPDWVSGWIVAYEKASPISTASQE